MFTTSASFFTVQMDFRCSTVCPPGVANILQNSLQSQIHLWRFIFSPIHIYNLYSWSFFFFFIPARIHVISLDARKRREASGYSNVTLLSSQFGMKRLIFVQFAAWRPLIACVCLFVFHPTSLICWELKQVQRLYLAKIIIYRLIWLQERTDCSFLMNRMFWINLLIFQINVYCL